jgi:hypothetical protein
MKAFRILAVIIPAVLFMFSASVAEEKPWFDMENCSFCKTLTEDPGLLDNMTWEHHDIANGALSLTMVNDEFKESYLKAQKKMEKLGMEMAGGKAEVHMCGHCEAYGGFMMLGAKFEVVESGAGWIILMTSDKPEVIKKIHEFAQRNRDELAKMEKSE